MAKSGRLELGDNIYGHIFNHCDVIGHQKAIVFGEKRKIRAVTPFMVIQGHPRSSRLAVLSKVDDFATFKKEVHAKNSTF